MPGVCLSIHIKIRLFLIVAALVGVLENRGRYILGKGHVGKYNIGSRKLCFCYVAGVSSYLFHFLYDK